MKKNRFFILGMAALLLTFGVLLAACSKKAEGGAGSAAKSGGKASKETDFIYELNKAGDGVVITGYQKDAAGGNVVIPATIEGYPVVAVIFGNFSGFDDGGDYYKSGSPLSAGEIKAKGLRPPITSIVFPDSITEIRPDDDMVGCYFYTGFHLKSISFPKNLKKIQGIFSSPSLTAVKWPESLEEIGTAGEEGGGFPGAGFTKLVLPEGLKLIGDQAFTNCKNLTSVTIPGSIETIGNSAFASCPELTTVNIPAKAIKYPTLSEWTGAFIGCPKLTGIAVRKAIADTGYKGEF
jgi:hypothetical protein